MVYTEAYKFIEYANTLGSVWGLETIKELLKRLDNPQEKLKIIHIAGTNGKGSIGAYLEYGLRGASLSVGRYISPTIFTYLERFQINGTNMREEEFADYIGILKPICESMQKDGFRHPTAFEIETAMSFLFFLDRKVDIVLLECGMGGRDDATNVLTKPLATVFASISFDHTSILGNTLKDIAENKAGIMRKDCPVIIAHQDEINGDCAKEYLISCARNTGAPYYFADDFKDELPANPLKGTYQSINLRAALKTISVVFPAADMKKVYAGITKTKWPGRYEKISDKPIIIRDGGHNIAGVTALKESLSLDYPNKKIHLIMGIFKDKDFADMLKVILPIAYSFTAITPPNKARALDAKKLADTAISLGLCEQISTSGDTLNAYKSLNNMTDDDVVVICGSLSIMGQTEELCQK